jgi:hypothetical protein
MVLVRRYIPFGYWSTILNAHLLFDLLQVLNKFIFMDLLNRWVLEASGILEPRRSALEDDFEEEEEDKEEGEPMDVDEPNTREKVSILRKWSTLIHQVC